MQYISVTFAYKETTLITLPHVTWVYQFGERSLRESKAFHVNCFRANRWLKFPTFAALPCRLPLLLSIKGDLQRNNSLWYRSLIDVTGGSSLGDVSVVKPKAESKSNGEQKYREWCTVPFPFPAFSLFRVVTEESEIQTCRHFFSAITGWLSGLRFERSWSHDREKGKGGWR